MAGKGSGAQWEWSIPHKEGMEKLLETGFRSDVTLVLGPQKEQVRVHKIFLQAKSRVLDALLMRCVKTNSLELNIKDVDTFKWMLKYFYTGTCGAPILTTLPLLKMATDFGVMELRDQCTDLIRKEIITLDNALPLFEEAMRFGNKELIGSTLKFICENGAGVMRTPEFSKLRLECLVEIIQQDDIRIKDEMQVFNAVYRWGQTECERQKLDYSLDPSAMRHILAKPLELIRFPLMNQAEFAIHVATKNVLTSDEALNILLSFLVPPEQRSLFPQGQFTPTPRKYYQDTVGLRAARGPTSSIQMDKAISISTTEVICFMVQGHESLQLKGIGFLIEIFPDRFWRPRCRHRHIDVELAFRVNVNFSVKGTLENKKEVLGIPMERSGGFYHVPFTATIIPNITYKLMVEFTGYSACQYESALRSCEYTDARYHVKRVTNFIYSPATILNQEGKASDANFEIHYSRDTPNDPVPITSGFVHHLVFDVDG